MHRRTDQPKGLVSGLGTISALQSLTSRFGISRSRIIIADELARPCGLAFLTTSNLMEWNPRRRCAAMRPWKIINLSKLSLTCRAPRHRTLMPCTTLLLEEWPDDERGPKYIICREILLKYLEGGCPTAIARVAFVEAAREAGIYVDTTARPPPTGKLGTPMG
ncbi:DUF982 domain-containing protein [Phyllobacterium sp. A18/5-2]|uniref:DUF982 domain-containing protein n=1 Tax=Phyllobacterium sp. A18/5-2 TaxID=2978392 RepID=UPI0039659499